MTMSGTTLGGKETDCAASQEAATLGAQDHLAKSSLASWLQGIGLTGKQLDHAMAMCDEQLLESLEDMILLERVRQATAGVQARGRYNKNSSRMVFYLQRVGSGQWLGCRMCRFGCIHAD